jgi:hypothetical protein
MKPISKIMTGAAAAALVSMAAAAPAEARHRYNHDRVDAGDVIGTIAVIGGIAAIASALDRDGRSYGYNHRYRYRSGYTNAVNACGYTADRYGRGQVRITDVDRRGNRFRVRGVVHSGFDRGYDRYDRYDRTVGFSCTARANGRVTDFDWHGRYRY